MPDNHRCDNCLEWEHKYEIIGWCQMHHKVMEGRQWCEQHTANVGRTAISEADVLRRQVADLQSERASVTDLLNTELRAVGPMGTPEAKDNMQGIKDGIQRLADMAKEAKWANVTGGMPNGA